MLLSKFRIPTPTIIVNKSENKIFRRQLKKFGYLFDFITQSHILKNF